MQTKYRYIFYILEMECNIDAFYIILFSYAFIFYYSINIYYYYYRMIFLYSNIKIDTMRMIVGKRDYQETLIRERVKN